jgi:hypothetical protein
MPSKVPLFLKGDLGGFSNGDKKSPLPPLSLKGGILDIKITALICYL